VTTAVADELDRATRSVLRALAESADRGMLATPEARATAMTLSTRLIAQTVPYVKDGQRRMFDAVSVLVGFLEAIEAEGG
jgi:hypothetical protein